jgi:glycosyltransferase involved in cell wall biosynthesis
VKNDRDAWVQAIEEMLDDPDRRQRMADAAYERFLDRLTTDIISMQYDQLLRRIIESSSAKIA